jgi:hypothetical protein
MGNRTAKFVSALIGSVIAGAPLAAVSQNAPSAPGAASTANAASDCLASPKGVAPQGQHWFYRLERGTKRQCWYLRAEGAKATQSAQATQGAQTTADTPNAAPAAAQSVQNAHAEYIAPQTGAAASAPAPTAASTPQASGLTDANAAQPAVATRWPDATSASPAPQPSPATAAEPAAASAQPSATPAASPAPVTLAAADALADKPTGSLQMLLLVVGGALALAGLIASVIYRFAGGRVRVPTADRRVNWDHRQDDDGSRAPWHSEPAPRVERPLPVDFDAMRVEAPQIAAFSDAIGRIAAQGRSVEVATAEPDRTEIDDFDGEFEIEPPAPQLAADDLHQHKPAEHDADAQDDHARDENGVEIDIITAMLERLVSEGPRLTQPGPEADLASLEADLAALARSSRGRSAARA